MGQRLKTGYCSWCANNTPHGHYASSAMAGICHAMARVFAGAAGYGPWYCSECRRVTSFMMPPVEDRPSAPVEAFDVPAAADVKRPLKAPASEHPFRERARLDAVGKNQQATSRYSEKYRQAIARRIFEGSTTFNQVKAELSVSKQEVWGWLVALYCSDQEQIGQLKRQVHALEESLSMHIGDSEFGDRVVAPSSVDLQNWSTVVVDANFESQSEFYSQNGPPAP